MKVLIMGGCGFLGSELALRMKQTFEVTVLDIQRPPPFLVDIDYACFDLNKDDLSPFIDEADMLIHCIVIQVPRINVEPWLGYRTNVLGIQKVCEAVEESEACKAMVHVSTHEVGEEHVEERSRLYQHTKLIQEKIVEWYQMVGKKRYGIARIGTLLGEHMNPNTAAHIFIKNALEGKPVTPYAHSLLRPIHYIDVEDACRLIQNYAEQVLAGTGAPLVTFTYPTPITILELAKTVQALTNAEIQVLNPASQTGQLTHPTQTISRIVKAWEIQK